MPRDRLSTIACFFSRQVGQLQHLSITRPALAPALDLERRREELQVLVDRQIVVHPQEIRHVAEHAPDERRRRCGRHARPPAPPRVRRQQARQDLHRRALARAVGPDEPEDLARADFQRQVFQRHQRAEPLCQAPRATRCTTLRRPRPLRAAAAETTPCARGHTYHLDAPPPASSSTLRTTAPSAVVVRVCSWNVANVHSLNDTGPNCVPPAPRASGMNPPQASPAGESEFKSGSV
jgi:hypothetical protein